MTAWLLTWLWQGTALAAGAAVALRYAPQRNATTRHLMLLSCFIALAWLCWAGSPYGAPYGALTPGQVRGADPVYIPSAPELLVSIFLGIWAAVAIVSLVRVLRGLRDVYAVRGRCRAFPPDIESRLPLWLEAKARGRRCELMICDAVHGATVLGFHNPCIAIPPMLVEALTVHELDLVILHEHAHVQRRDDWSRLAQTVLWSVLWVHPAALFLSRALNRECEMACDEWVVARTGLPKAYARCLARAAEVHARMSGSRALVPALIGSRHELVRRVDRVLAIHDKARRRVSMASASVAACAMVILTVPLQVVRFGELVEIVFPVDQVQQVRWVQQVRGVQEARSVQQEVRGQQVRRVQQKRPVPQLREFASGVSAPLVSDYAPTEPIAPVGALIAPVGAPIAPIAPSAPDLSALEGEPSGWRALAAPAVDIATSTKKASVGVAHVFSRAGLRLARSF